MITTKLGMMRLSCFFCSVVFVSLAAAQTSHIDADVIPKSDPIYPVLEKRRAEIQNGYEKGKIVQAKFSSWKVITSPSATSLFPNLKFAFLSWSEFPNPEAKKKVYGLAYGIGQTVAIDAASNEVKATLYDTGNYDEFGKLLANQKIRIESADEAMKVWDAFCEIHQKQWKNQPVIKISDTIWHLGDTTIDRFHYYYEVLLSEQKVVQSAKLHADEIKVPAKSVK